MLYQNIFLIIYLLLLTQKIFKQTYSKKHKRKLNFIIEKDRSVYNLIIFYRK